jgi:hypothetical protein
VLGELRLAVDDSVLAGTLDWETSDSNSLPLTGRVLEDGALEWWVTGRQPWRFAGRLVDDSLTGQAFRNGRSPLPWVAGRLGDSAEFYAPLPRFTQRQVVLWFAGTTDTVQQLPGPWLKAAEARGHTPQSVLAGYQEVTRAAGVAALERDELGKAVVLRAMGLYRRDEMVAVHRAVLSTIRTHLPDDTTRTRFDFLFRPTGGWQVDIHDVALGWAQTRRPGLDWRAAEQALAAAGQFSKSGLMGVDSIPRGLYRLFVLSRSDSGRFHSQTERMRVQAPESFEAVTELLAGYQEALAWYRAVMRFLLVERWFGDPDPRSVLDLTKAAWELTDALVPEIRPQPFGYPEGIPVAGVFPALLDQLIVPQNQTAVRWLARHGSEGLRQVLGRINGPVGDAPVLELGAWRYDLSTVAKEARRSRGGFLEAEDVVLIDPSYMPLLALGTVLHEWHHIVHAHARLDAHVSDGASGVTLVQSNLFLAEGLAEYASDQVMQEIAGRYPVMVLGEAEKLAEMAAMRPTDPHLMGFLLFRTLADILPEGGALRRLLARGDNDPSWVVRDPSVVPLLRPYRDTPDLSVGSARRPVVIPEVTFTVEDGFPFVEATRIVVPERNRPSPPEPPA